MQDPLESFSHCIAMYCTLEKNTLYEITGHIYIYIYSVTCDLFSHIIYKSQGSVSY